MGEERGKECGNFWQFSLKFFQCYQLWCLKKLIKIYTVRKVFLTKFFVYFLKLIQYLTSSYSSTTHISVSVPAFRNDWC